jgi:hypothetical protein
MRSAQETWTEGVRLAKSMSEKRAHPRFRLGLPATFLLADQSEHDCVIEDASASGFSIASELQPRIGAVLVVYCGLLGRLEVQTVRHHQTGFAVEIQATADGRRKLGGVLKWAAAQMSAGRSFQRTSERRSVEGKETVVRLRDGTTIVCKLKNISRAGAAIESKLSPGLNTLITVGSQRARVVRATVDGFAVEFLRKIPPEIFEKNFVP